MSSMLQVASGQEGKVQSHSAFIIPVIYTRLVLLVQMVWVKKYSKSLADH